ncbi:MAG: hypothetical protein K0S08_648 [Gammaproteobacteria bacterium]|jgi:hypothetical protein|nr:hypothetical protein [Gammaproteobacteria bacterium]
MLISYAKQDELMRTLIEILGSQAAVAKALKVRKQKFHYWLTEAKHGAPYEQLLRMEALLKKCLEEKAQLERQRQIRQGKFCDAISLFDNSNFPAGTPSLSSVSSSYATSSELSVSQRVQIGLDHENAIGNHQGERHDLQEEVQKYLTKDFSHDQLQKNFYKVSPERDFNGNSPRARLVNKPHRERKDEKAAKLAGFSNVTTYVQARKVYQHGCAELIQAMDEEKIAIDLATRLAKESYETQKELLQKSPKEIRAYFKNKNSDRNKKIINELDLGAGGVEAPYQNLLYMGLTSLLIFNEHYTNQRNVALPPHAHLNIPEVQKIPKKLTGGFGNIHTSKKAPLSSYAKGGQK